MAMKFYLERHTHKGKNYYYLLLSIIQNKHRVTRKLNIDVIDPELWDSKEQRFNTTKPYYKKINNQLISYQAAYNKWYYKKTDLLEETISKNAILEFIRTELFRQKAARLEFYDLLDQFIEDAESDPEKSEGTVKVYITLKNHLQRFNKNLYFADINEQFAKDFLKYLNHTKNLTNLTANKVFRTLKTFCRYCQSKNYRFPNENFRDLLKTPKPKAQTVALTINEIRNIIDYTPCNSALQVTKDLFLFQIFTGLRFSDMQNLKPSNINLLRLEITLTQIKTREQVIIPMLPIVKDILLKYNSVLPKVSQQKYNIHIKELCEYAAINDPILKVYYYGKKRVEKELSKYELISSHTARRSFATACLSLGMTAYETMKLTGHQDVKSFDVYVKPDSKEIFEKFKQLDFGVIKTN